MKRPRKREGASGLRFLADADDDMVLELAFAAGCGHIITHNGNDFRGSEQLGVAALSPREFLKLIGKHP